ncbi:hypothetical protein Sste5346_008316 [Sporothrix stenoceras]|uniref:Beta-lactamase-related domain-containing protein n=1 Tax=Sporothrix stenoceras TaxID=5173 RepID=A0ABR3YSI7_9PEZI
MATHRDGLTRATPESVGVSSASIAQFLDDLSENNIEVHTFMLYHAGSVIAEGSWWPYRADRPHMMHSATKSFLAVAVGLAIEEGYFSVNTKVVDIFPEEAKAASDGQAISENLTALTVEDLLTQTSGHAHGVSGGEWRGIKTSWVTEFFRLPLVHKPGTKFVYTSATSFMLSAIISQTTGSTVREFLEPRFCRPLGIKLLAWDVGPDGICPGGNGISCLPSDFLKLGILHLQKGKWEGKQILPESWAVACTTAQRGNLYGYHWWTDTEKQGYYASGMFGQLCFVFPQHDAVLAITAAGMGDAEPLQRAVWRHFPKAFGTSSKPLDVTENIASIESLTSGLDHVRLPTMTITAADEQPTSDFLAQISKERFTCVTPNDDGVFSFALDISNNEQSLAFHMQDARGHHTLNVGLVGTHVEGITTLSGAKLHHGYEPASLRVVATAAWVKSDTLQMVLQFTETAFRDTLSVRFFAIDEHIFAQLDRSVNVNSFATQRPPLFGVVLTTGKELGSPELATIISSAQRSKKLSTSGCTVGELLDHPAARAILEKAMPKTLEQDGARIEKARKYSLDMIIHHAGLTEEDLVRIDDQLAQIPAE